MALLAVQPTTTGFQTVGRLAPDFDDEAVAVRARERGIILSPVGRFAIAPAQSGLILGFSAVPPRATAAAVQDLGHLLRQMRCERAAPPATAARPRG